MHIVPLSSDTYTSYISANMDALDKITSLKDIDVELGKVSHSAISESKSNVHMFGGNTVLDHKWSMSVHNGKDSDSPCTLVARFESTDSKSNNPSNSTRKRFRKRDRYFIQKLLMFDFMNDSERNVQYHINGHGVHIERSSATVKEDGVLFDGARTGDIVAAFHVYVTDDDEVMKDIDVLCSCIEALSLRVKFPKAVIFVHADKNDSETTSKTSSPTYLTDLWNKLSAKGTGVASFVVITSSLLTRGLIRMVSMFTTGGGNLKLQCMENYEKVIQI